MGLHCGSYYSNCAVIGHSHCQTANVTRLGGMLYCNQTLFLSGRVGSGDETIWADVLQYHNMEPHINYIYFLPASYLKHMIDTDII